MRTALLLGLTACAATGPAVDHAGPVTGLAVIDHELWSCSQAGVFVAKEPMRRLRTELPFRPVCVAGTAHVRLIGGGTPGRSGELAMLDPGGRLLASTRVGNDLVYAVALREDGSAGACACADGRILWFGVPGWSGMRTVHRHDGPARAVAFTRTGTSLVSGGRDGRLLFTDLATGATVVNVDHSAGIECITVLPHGGTLSGARDGKVRVHSTDTRLLRTYLRLGAPVIGLAVAGEDWLAALASGQVLRLSQNESEAALWLSLDQPLFSIAGGARGAVWLGVDSRVVTK